LKAARIFATILLSIFILIYTYETALGIELESQSKNVYIVVANKLTLQDIQKMPNLINLLDESGIGLMNVRGTSGYTGAEGFATINASAKTYANNMSSQFHNLNWEYRDIYENRVGKLNGQYSVGNIELGRLYNQNEDNSYDPRIGLLGDILHENGLKTAVFGNSDTADHEYRYAALIPMDSKGLIDYGNVDNILVQDEDYPYGLKTDYNRILEEVNDIKHKASLIVIDTGDLFRLHNESNTVSDDVFLEKRNKILADIDSFIGKLIENINKESLLFILSPNSGEERINGSRLTPVILWGSNVSKGLLISSTTNRLGIIANLDIAPTVAEFFGLKISNASGNIIKWKDKGDAFQYIKSINSRIDLTSKARSKSLTVYGIISIIVLSIAAFFILVKVRMDYNINRLLRILLLILYGIPLILIISSMFNIVSIGKFINTILLLIIIYAILLTKYNGIKALYGLTYAYCIIISADIAFDGLFSEFSVLSYDPVIGARYFGIGNEMAGLFLAVSMTGIGLLYSKVKKKSLLGLMLALSVLLVGHPKLGANVGGMITFLSASLFFILEVMEKKISLKNLIAIAFITVIAVGLLGLIDMRLNPNPTHLGKTLLKIGGEGIDIASNIIVRKIMMNIKLVGSSFWTKVLFSNIIIQLIISCFHGDKYEKLENMGFNKGFISCITGSIVGFLVNDSGLILSAIAINMITALLMFIFIEDSVTYSNRKWI